MSYHFSAPPGRAAMVRHPLWGGELTLEPSSDISFEERSASPIIIVKAVSSGAVGYRRSARAVRRHEQRFHILTFVDRGCISVSHSHDTVTLDTDFISISKNATAYIARLLPDADGGVEIYTLRVPDHIIAPYLPRGFTPGVPLPAAKGTGASARALVKLLFEHGGSMPAPTLDKVLGALLELVSLTVNVAEAHSPPRLPANERRFLALEAYVTENIADSTLSLAKSSAHLGVTTRYVSSILRQRGVRFRDFVKHRRIALAKDLLSRLDGNSYTIAEIAALTGFSTASQFATAFRASTGCTPGTWRKSAA